MQRRNAFLGTMATCFVIALLFVLQPAMASYGSGGNIYWYDKTNDVGTTHPGDDWYWAYTDKAEDTVNDGSTPGVCCVYVYDGSVPGGILWRVHDGPFGWTKLTPTASGGMPTQRWNYACLARSGTQDPNTAQGRLILFGGISKAGVWLNEVNVYDIQTNDWVYKGTGLNPAPSPRTWPGCGKLHMNAGNWILEGITVYGGEDQTWNALGDVWVFCDVTRNVGAVNGCRQRGWNGPYTILPTPVGRYMAAFVEMDAANPAGSSVYNVFGGYGPTGALDEAWQLQALVCVQSCDRLDWNYLAFTQDTPRPAARYGVGAGWHGDIINPGANFGTGMLLFGGKLADGTTTNEVWAGTWTSWACWPNTCRDVYWEKETQTGAPPPKRWAPLFACKYSPAYWDSTQEWVGCTNTPFDIHHQEFGQHSWYVMFGGLDGPALKDTRLGCISWSPTQDPC